MISPAVCCAVRSFLLGLRTKDVHTYKHDRSQQANGRREGWVHERTIRVIGCGWNGFFRWPWMVMMLPRVSHRRRRRRRLLRRCLCCCRRERQRVRLCGLYMLQCYIYFYSCFKTYRGSSSSTPSKWILCCVRGCGVECVCVCGAQTTPRESQLMAG